MLGGGGGGGGGGGAMAAAQRFVDNPANNMDQNATFSEFYEKTEFDQDRANAMGLAAAQTDPVNDTFQVAAIDPSLQPNSPTPGMNNDGQKYEALTA